jgi:GTPase Era involved in 16S rRNA processing
MHHDAQQATLRVLRIVVTHRDFQAIELDAPGIGLIGIVFAHALKAIQTNRFHTVQRHDRLDHIAGV